MDCAGACDCSMDLISLIHLDSGSPKLSKSCVVKLLCCSFAVWFGFLYSGRVLSVLLLLLLLLL